MGAKLVLVRHGQSQWNRLNLFTGWVNIPLSPDGIEESFQVGEKIKNIDFAVAFTSNLIRAQMTLFLAWQKHQSQKIAVLYSQEEEQGAIHSKETEKKSFPVFASNSLNERRYGDLQGLNKAETAKKFGEEQVKVWRRSYQGLPPNGESLEMTVQRVIPYFENEIQPYLEKGQNVLVVAHGNSLRAIVKYLEDLSEDQILEFEIQTGEIITYSYGHGRWKKEL